MWSEFHKATFDDRLIALDEKLRVVLRKHLKISFPHSTLEQDFVPIENQPIDSPDKLAEPAPELLRYHRQEIFQG